MKKSGVKPKLLIIGIVIAMIASTVFLSGATTYKDLEKTPTGPHKETIRNSDEYDKTLNVSGEEKIAIEFIKEIYSDFRTINNDVEFNKKVSELVYDKNTEFKKILQDRKYIRDKFNSLENMRIELKEHSFDKLKIIKSTNKDIVFSVNGTYKYRDLNDVDLKKYEKEAKEEILLGEEVPYAVHLTKEKGKWKIANITSGDLTSAYMFEELENLSERSTADVVHLMLNKSRKQHLKYDVKEIIKRIEKVCKGSEVNIPEEKNRGKETLDVTNVSLKNLRSGGQAFTEDQRAYMRQYQIAWWNGFNPAYKRFSADCANYASQVIRASGCPYGDSYPWYPYTLSWIRVSELRDFLINNSKAFGGAGPYGYQIKSRGNLDSGDLIQDGNSHTFSVFSKSGDGYPYVTAHTNPRFDKMNRFLSDKQIAEFNIYIQVLGYTNM